MAAKLFFKNATGETAFVDTGFSWAAFFFGPLWAVVKRQWKMFLLLCLAQLPFTVIYAFAEQKDDMGLYVLNVLLALIYMMGCGIYGNRLHRHFLERQGYVFESFA